ncbi:MAG: hypothetical protein COT91_00480 [Candidatus Doudnabacteria bacterium CG10_big_fil_rev_8_21_14_0_10_41_10]|uniref:Uncharacterized protein n=1 Tax=Candidatus Doudnabacteria bacterium CG10_big_fil_rev_8_21_14_0_10_41_10 TaxID=1974551 RepID=A0A2H0VER5_9BACT|nr:MAG: hypothetical protein COT91_00480 [Candidatus Doudnabacteria bacterium CG10_big_fil_rev_8_21_14_0_10_41_10]
MNTPYTASTLHKVLAFGLAISVVVWTFGVLLVVPAQAVDAHPNGTLVLSGSTVFKIMDGQRLGYPTANTFFSHGYDWNQVVPANSADLALPQGANVMFADGSLVNDNGTIFMVSEGQKRGFTTPSVFFGLGYSFDMALTGDLSGVPQGENIDSATAAHPAGSLVNDNGTIYKVTITGKSGIATMAVFNSWGFDFAKVVPANAADMALAAGANLGYRVGSVVNDNGTVWAITSETMKQGFPSASCFLDSGYQWVAVVDGTTSGYTAGDNLCVAGDPGTPPVSSTGTLTVSLASDTPASGIAIKSAARVPFTKVNLTATGGDVVIDNWVVERAGISQDSSFSSLDIIDLSTNAAINDSGKTLNSSHTANFTDDLTIPNGTTKSVMLAGNMATSPGAGEEPTLALNSITLKGGSVNGSFPVVGNKMTINTSIVIGTATVSRGSYTNATSTSIEVGKTAYTFFSFQVAAGSAEDVTFSQVKVYQQGSASLSSDLANLKLYRDGTFLADGTVNNSFVSFAFPAELIKKGQTSQYLVKSDVVDGSARTIDLGIWRTTDLLVTGQTYGANITPTYTGESAAVNSNPVLSDNQFTISTGSLRVGRSSTVGAENITVGDNQVLGAFEFEAKGEPVEITALTLTTASSTTNGQRLESVRLVDANGATVAGPVDVALALTVALTDSFTVPVGVSHYQVIGTVPTSGGWATNDTITVSFTPSSAITAKGEVTGQTITPTPSSSISASTQTVKAAILTVTKDSVPTNKTVVTNDTGVLSGAWTLDATDSGEDIRITTIAIRASSTGKLNNLTLKADGVALDPINAAPTSGAAATSSFALSSPLVVTKGTSVSLNLYTDIGSNSNAGEVSAFGLTDTTSATNASVVAYGVDTGNRATVTLTASDGALLTIAAAGTLTVNVHGDNPASRLVVHGTSGVVLSEVKLKADNENVDITKLTVNVVDGALTGTAAGAYDQVEKMFLKVDGVVIGNASGYNLSAAITTINLTKGALSVPEGGDATSIKLSVIGDIVDIGTNQPGTANADIKVGLGAYGNTTTGWTATGSGSNTAATITYTDSTGSAIILHKAVPSVVVENPGTSLTPSATLHRTKISAVGGQIGVYRLAYATASTSGLVLTNAYTKLQSCTGSCGSITTGSQLSDLDADGDYLVDGTETWNLAISSSQSHGKRWLPVGSGSTAVVDLMMTVTGFTTSSDAVSTSLLGDTATTTNDTGGDPAAVYTVNNQGNFVWSDLNLDESQAAASLTSKQWYNGYLVAGLGGAATSTAITISD